MNKKCKVENCDYNGNCRLKKGLCPKHYSRFKKYGQYELPKKEKKMCSVEGCKNYARSLGLCNMHRLRLKNNGEVGEAEPRKGNGGTGYISKTTGYKYFHKPSHPNACKNGTIAEHTIVMSKILGRPLKKGESVHHKNGIKTDNSINNLELMTGSHPTGQSIEDMVKFCQDYLKEYEKDLKLILNTHLGEE